MRRTIVTLLCCLGVAAAERSARADAIETFQVVVGNEINLEDGSELLYYENVTQLQKSWLSFDRSVHTLYAGTELLVEPALNEYTLDRRFGIDTMSAIIGYRYRTYLPDWYNFNIRLRVPVYVPSDPFGRAVCQDENDVGQRFEPITPGVCADERKYWDRLQLIVEPLTVKKSWNLFTLYDNSRVTLLPSSLEYSNKIRFINVTPDLEFPIALYVGDEIKLRKNIGEGARARNDVFVGLASNFWDWMHLGVEFMYHLDTHAEHNRTFVGEFYLELYFDIFFDNTSGDSRPPVREVYETEARG